jgi:hypothetical protein
MMTPEMIITYRLSHFAIETMIRVGDMAKFRGKTISTLTCAQTIKAYI